MNLVKCNRLGNAFDLMGSFFNDYPEQVVEKKYTPSVDIYEKENNFFIEAQMPGLKKEDIKLEIKDSKLLLSGESSKEKEVENKKEGYYRKEIIRGKFIRSFDLADSIDKDKMEANFEDGILKIKLPKNDKIKPKQIEIN